MHWNPLELPEGWDGAPESDVVDVGCGLRHGDLQDSEGASQHQPRCVRVGCGFEPQLLPLTSFVSRAKSAPGLPREAGFQHMACRDVVKASWPPSVPDAVEWSSSKTPHARRWRM